MIYDEIADTLLRAGIPVNTKGLYIFTMLRLMDKDPYYFPEDLCVIRKDSQAERSQFRTGRARDTLRF